jgi:hypothetical protein
MQKFRRRRMKGMFNEDIDWLLMVTKQIFGTLRLVTGRSQANGASTLRLPNINAGACSELTLSELYVSP